MTFLDVISAGPGAVDLLAPAAASALASADLVFCSDRLSSFVPDPERRRNLLPLSTTAETIRVLLSEGRHAAVLVSGDAGLYSLLPFLTERLGPENIHVIPGVSSIQAFCARQKITWQDARILSAHGRPLCPEVLCYHVRTNRRTIILLDRENHPERISCILTAGGLTGIRIIIGERISAQDECISEFQMGRVYDPLSLALIENDHPQSGLPPIGLPDDAFLRNKTPMTKQEIRIQIMATLALPIDARIWDIGAGTGSVTVECARQCPLGTVTAIEENADACDILDANIAAFHLQNVTVLRGTAPEALRSLPPPTHVFLGGTGGHAGEILDLLMAFGTPIRLSATAVTMESADFFLRRLQSLPNFSAVQITAARIETAGSSHLFRARNPVFVFAADIPGQSA